HHCDDDWCRFEGAPQRSRARCRHVYRGRNPQRDQARRSGCRPRSERAAGWRDGDDRIMNLAGLVDRYGRAIVLAVTLLAGAGLIAGGALPSSIYPRLEFPRVVVIGHRGRLPPRAMMMSVTRPLEQAAMEVPGIRRVRSTTFRGATEISAQFEPSTDMVVALQQVQGKIDDARPSL